MDNSKHNGEPEEPNFDTNFFVDNWGELDSEAKADLLKKKAEKDKTEFFKKNPYLTDHQKIAKSHAGPIRRPPTPDIWDAPSEPIDETASLMERVRRIQKILGY